MWSGNVAVSKIETEKLLSGMVDLELARRAKMGSYSGQYTPQFHFFGYDGRSGLPSRFDNNYCYSLGATAAALVEYGETGMMCSVTNLLAPVEEWECGGVRGGGVEMGVAWVVWLVGSIHHVICGALWRFVSLIHAHMTRRAFCVAGIHCCDDAHGASPRKGQGCDCKGPCGA